MVPCGEGESPEPCDTHPQCPLSPLPQGAVLGRSDTALVSSDPLSLSCSGAHHLRLCPGLRSSAGVWCPWGAGGADGGGGGGWLMHNAALRTEPAAELNSWRFEKLSACQTPVNCSAAVTRPASASLWVPAPPGGGQVLTPLGWCRELSCPRLRSPLVRPRPGAGCPSGRSPAAPGWAVGWLTPARAPAERSPARRASSGTGYPCFSQAFRYDLEPLPPRPG